jgi:hypothetical protein
LTVEFGVAFKMPVDLRFIATSAVVAQVLSVDIRTPLGHSHRN